MDRSEIVRAIIVAIKNLKDETRALFSKESLLEYPNLMIDEFFQQKFNPLKDKIKVEIRRLPADEYIAIELDAWIKLLVIKLNTVDSDENTSGNDQIIHIYRRFYPELINTLSELKLEVLETEFDARVDGVHGSRQNLIADYGPNTLVVSPAVVASLITLMYNFNLLRASVSVDTICNLFSTLTGYGVESISQHVEFDKLTGRLKTQVNCDDLLQLEKILKSMLSRLDYVISYNADRD